MELVLHERTRRALAAISDRPAGSYLFYGPPGAGKATAALELARSLNCRGPHTSGSCPACAQFAAGAYPDLITIRREDKPSVTIEQVRRLSSALSMQPYYKTGRRIVIIDDADFLTTDAANALLKLLEEPPPRTSFILVAAAAETLLPTVRSRCVAVYFPLPPSSQIVGLLTTRHNLRPADATRLVDAAAGAPGAALALAADPEAVSATLNLAERAAAATSLNRFDRLRLAAELAAAPADLERFARSLHSHLVSSLRTGAAPTATADSALAALERFRLQLHAKVSPRVAAERLMLEL